MNTKGWIVVLVVTFAIAAIEGIIKHYEQKYPTAHVTDQVVDTTIALFWAAVAVLCMIVVTVVVGFLVVCGIETLL